MKEKHENLFDVLCSYADEATKTLNYNYNGFWEKMQKLFPEAVPDVDSDPALINLELGVKGESGEVLEVIKKYLTKDNVKFEDFTAKLSDELGDLLWYSVLLNTPDGFIDQIFKSPNLVIDKLLDSPIELDEFDVVILAASILNGKVVKKSGKGSYTTRDSDDGATYTIPDDLDVGELTSTMKSVMDANIQKIRARHGEKYNPNY